MLDLGVPPSFLFHSYISLGDHTISHYTYITLIAGCIDSQRYSWGFLGKGHRR